MLADALRDARARAVGGGVADLDFVRGIASRDALAAVIGSPAAGTGGSSDGGVAKPVATARMVKRSATTFICAQGG